MKSGLSEFGIMITQLSSTAKMTDYSIWLKEFLSHFGDEWDFPAFKQELFQEKNYSC